MKRNILLEMKNDLWVIAMDAIAVNLSYILALILRYFVHNIFINAAYGYLNATLKFAPFYTIICIAVFALFKLYNGMWRYARLSDMNRIIAASVTTAIIYVIGTVLFVKRMPISYYVLGAGIQFMWVTFTRYIYRFVSVEQQLIKNKNLPVRNVMIVGSHMSSQKVIKYLENEPSFKPVVVVDSKSSGKYVNGLPVVEDPTKAIESNAIKCIIIADPFVPNDTREALRKITEGTDIELHDYTGFLKNDMGRLPLTDLVQVIDGPFVLYADGQKYESVEEAMQQLKERYTVESIRGKDLTITIQPERSKSPDTDWTEKYKAENGEDVSFF